MMQFSDLPGTITYEEGMILESLIRGLGATTIIETGCGFSTHFLAKGLGSIGTQGKVFIYEHDEEKAEAVCQMLKDECLLSYCEFIIGDSLKNLRNLRQDGIEGHICHASLAFVDSDHSFDHVFKELRLIYECLPIGGILIGHDAIHDSGAGRAYKSFAVKHGLSHIVLPTQMGLSILQ